MAFSFSYVYEASDKFTPVAKKIAKTVKSLNKELDETSKLMKSTNASTRTLQNKLQKTFEQANPHILRSKQLMSGMSKETNKTTIAVKELHDIAKKKIKGSVEITNKTRGGAGGGTGVSAPIAGSKRGGGGSSKFTPAGGLAAAAGVVATLGGLTKVSDIFTKYENNLTSIQRVMQPTADEMDFLKGRAKELGKEFSQSSVAVLGTYKTVSQFTGDIPMGDLDKMVEASIILAKAGETTPEMAGRSIASTLAQFGKEADNAALFMDIMAQASSAGSSEITDTAEALSIAGSVASMTGLNFRETNAALQALGKNAIIGRRAGTGLAGALMNLQTQSFGGVSIMKDGLIPVLDKLAKKQGDAAFFTEVFGKEHAKSGLAMVQHRKFIQELTGSLGEEGAAMKLAMMSSDNLGTSWSALGSILEVKVIETMERLAPAMKTIMDDFTNWLDTVDSGDIQGVADSFIILGKSLVWVANGMAMLGSFTKMQGERAGQIAAMYASGGSVWDGNFDDTKFLEHEKNFENSFDNFMGFGAFQDKPTSKSVDVPMLQVQVTAADGTAANATVTGHGIMLETGENVSGE